MIVNFRDKNTAAFYRGERVSSFNGIERVAERKLDQLDAATTILDLSRPGNHLEKLKRNREGQYSIRVNDQWRICFEWPKGASGPHNVEIVDYHS
jgi:toxin HigB-1